MGIMLSHRSAYYAQLQNAAYGKGRLPSTRLARIPSYDARAVDVAKGFMPEGVDIELLVPSVEARHYGKEKCHVWNAPLPPGAIQRLSNGVYVASPEFLFLQAAGHTPFVPLVRFGYELCALYTVRLAGGNYVELQESLTTAARIKRFLDACDGLYGARKAREAIPWVLDRSRSPRESDFAISFTLPRLRGGQAVRGLELNKVVSLTKEEQRKAGKHHYEVDFSFEGIADAFEYYGRDAHEGPIRTVKDIRRESILKSKGIVVHGITQIQAENMKELERLAELVAKAQGRRWRRPTIQQERAMLGLLRMLYPNAR